MQGKSPQNQNGTNPEKKTTPVGFVSHVQGDGGVDSSSIEMHKDAWVGAINLSEEKVKLLRSMFKCVQCQTNDKTPLIQRVSLELWVVLALSLLPLKVKPLALLLVKTLDLCPLFWKNLKIIWRWITLGMWNSIYLNSLVA